jgi:hypothetical protein
MWMLIVSYVDIYFHNHIVFFHDYSTGMYRYIFWHLERFKKAAQNENKMRSKFRLKTVFR